MAGSSVVLLQFTIVRFDLHPRRERFCALSEEGRRTIFQESVGEVSRMLDQNLLLKFKRHIILKKGGCPLVSQDHLNVPMHAHACVPKSPCFNIVYMPADRLLFCFPPLALRLVGRMHECSTAM